MVCSCTMSSQLIICSCANETTLFSFLRRFAWKWQSGRYSLKKDKLGDRIKLGLRKISWFVSDWQITILCSTSCNNCLSCLDPHLDSSLSSAWVFFYHLWTTYQFMNAGVASETAETLWTFHILLIMLWRCRNHPKWHTKIRFSLRYLFFTVTFFVLSGF